MSRPGMPLVSELIIGLPDKDKSNASEPKDDIQFAVYVTNPTLPVLLASLYAGAGVQAPTSTHVATWWRFFWTGYPTSIRQRR
jgi:Domain of unknown function (DUF4331)